MTAYAEERRVCTKQGPLRCTVMRPASKKRRSRKKSEKKEREIKIMQPEQPASASSSSTSSSSSSTTPSAGESISSTSSSARADSPIRGGHWNKYGVWTPNFLDNPPGGPDEETEEDDEELEDLLEVEEPVNSFVYTDSSDNGGGPQRGHSNNGHGGGPQWGRSNDVMGGGSLRGRSNMMAGLLPKLDAQGASLIVKAPGRGSSHLATLITQRKGRSPHSNAHFVGIMSDTQSSPDQIR